MKILTKRNMRSPGAVAALSACLVLAFLPACGTVGSVREAAPHYVTVTEPDGSVCIETAAAAGIGKVERHAGEFCCPSFNCPGDGWAQLVILGFYAVGYAVYFIGYGIYWCVDNIVEACSGQMDCSVEVMDDAT